MVDEDAIQARRMSAAQIMVAGSNPFFSSLMMMAPTIFTSDVPTAATDGVRMFYNSQFMKKLSLREFAGVVVHEVLHAALLHLPRRGNRHPYLWNIAADIQVNSLIRSQMSLQKELDLPEGVVEDQSLAHLSWRRSTRFYSVMAVRKNLYCLICKVNLPPAISKHPI
jgi:predicted metal-dependent peptidase